MSVPSTRRSAAASATTSTSTDATSHACLRLSSRPVGWARISQANAAQATLLTRKPIVKTHSSFENVSAPRRKR